MSIEDPINSLVSTINPESENPVLQYIDKAFFKKLFLLALPVSLQFLLHSARYIADVVMLGQIGENELAAAGLVTSIHMLANSVIWGMGGGVGILCAQYFGASDLTSINRTVSIGITVGQCLMAPVVLVFLIFPEAVVSIATDQPELIPLGATYLRITSVLPMLIGIIVSIGASLNAIGKPHMNMSFTAVAVLCNVFLNWMLIFGNLGAPALGLAGAAIATSGSIALEVVIIFVYLRLSNNALQVNFGLIRRSLHKPDIVRFLRISVPITIGGVVWHAGSFVYQTIYGHMGANELAVITMIVPLRTICFSFFWGISSATGVIMGHHLGAGEFDMAFGRSWILVGLGFIASIVAAAGIWFFEDPIFSLFGGMAAATLADARDVLLVMLLTIPILSVNVVGIVGVLQSGADNRFILGMDVFCQWAVGIPLCWLCAFYFQVALHWVFLAAFSEEIVKLLFWIPRVASRAWIRNLVGQ